MELLQNLDQRISVLTIFLSVLLLAIAVIELLCAFNVIKEVSSQPMWKFCLFYLFTEVVPTFIMCFLLRNAKDGHSQIDVELIKERLATKFENQKKDQSGDQSDENSDYGNFNPNLNKPKTKKQKSDMSLSDVGRGSFDKSTSKRTSNKTTSSKQNALLAHPGG